jgi:hypothetical protein
MKRELIGIVIAAGALGLLASGCVVHETVVRRDPPCVGGVWIGGHYDGAGRWHRPHWRCPGVIEVIE